MHDGMRFRVLIMNPATSLADPSARYTRTAIVLHWLLAVMIITAFTAGTLLDGMEFSPFKLKLISWHKWLGVSIFAFVVLRLVWRLTHRPPPLPAGPPLWQRHLAAMGHFTLYALMVVIPLTGWLYSSAAGVPTVWFGVLPLPDLLDRNESLANVLRGAHAWLNNGLLLLVLGHVGAAFYHHYHLRDGLLSRMKPYWR